MTLLTFIIKKALAFNLLRPGDHVVNKIGKEKSSATIFLNSATKNIYFACDETCKPYSTIREWMNGRHGHVMGTFAIERDGKELFSEDQLKEELSRVMELHDLDPSVKSLERTIEGLSTEIREIKSKNLEIIETIKEEEGDLKHLVSFLRAKNEALKAQNEELRSENESLKGEVFLLKYKYC